MTRTTATATPQLTFSAAAALPVAVNMPHKTKSSRTEAAFFSCVSSARKIVAGNSNHRPSAAPLLSVKIAMNSLRLIVAVGLGRFAPVDDCARPQAFITCSQLWDISCDLIEKSKLDTKFPMMQLLKDN